VFDARYPDEAFRAATWPEPDTILVANKIDFVSCHHGLPDVYSAARLSRVVDVGGEEFDVANGVRR
jgi:hypothetical protein